MSWKIAEMDEKGPVKRGIANIRDDDPLAAYSRSTSQCIVEKVSSRGAVICPGKQQLSIEPLSFLNNESPVYDYPHTIL